MHLLETFSLSTGIKIKTPWILEQFFPLGLDGDFITLQPFGKFESRKYDYWNEVLSILVPILDKNNIHVIQVGGGDEPRLDNVVYLAGQTTYNQTAYLIRNGILHLGIDSFGVHIASGFGKKIVALYCNMHLQHSRPYWSSKEDVVLIESDKKGDKPTYAEVEDPKTINTIFPEDISKAVCNLLNLDFDYSFKTLYIGENYKGRTYEMIPAHPVYVADFKVNNNNLDSIIVRMDLLFNEKVLDEQLQEGNCSILTNKPINIDILKKHRKRIKEFVYLIDENHSPEYVRVLRANGIKCTLFSFLLDEELDKYKLDYIDVGKIIQRPKLKREDIEEIKDKEDKNLFYKSCKHYLIGELAFWSKDPDYFSKPIKLENQYVPQKIVPTPDFWDHADCYHILEKV